MIQKPDCPKCDSNRNVIEFAAYLRCAFCGTRISKDIKQTKLKFWVK